MPIFGGVGAYMARTRPWGMGPPDVMTFPDSNFLGLRLHHGQELIGMGNALNNACMGVMALTRAFHKRSL